MICLVLNLNFVVLPKISILSKLGMGFLASAIPNFALWKSRDHQFADVYSAIEVCEALLCLCKGVVTLY